MTKAYPPPDTETIVESLFLIAPKSKGLPPKSQTKGEIFSEVDKDQ
jgi:hypothetical protein